MIYPFPAEADAAYNALVDAREAVAAAVDELNNLRAPWDATVRFEQAHNALATHVEQIADLLFPIPRRDNEAMEAVEERHIEAQMFPWVDDP